MAFRVKRKDDDTPGVLYAQSFLDHMAYLRHISSDHHEGAADAGQLRQGIGTPRHDERDSDVVGRSTQDAVGRTRAAVNLHQ